MYLSGPRPRLRNTFGISVPATSTPKPLRVLASPDSAKLAQDRERFVASKIYGTQLEQGLALFDQAQAILEQPASPCF